MAVRGKVHMSVQALPNQVKSLPILTTRYDTGGSCDPPV